MAAAFETRITGADNVQRRLGRVANAIDRGNILDNALRAAALVAMNAAKQKAAVLAGNLRRSIHVGGFGDGLESPSTGTDIGPAPGSHVVAVGTNVVYAKRIEFGFAGTDSLGRTFHQPAQPYLRPALDENKREMTAEFGEAVIDGIRAELR